MWEMKADMSGAATAMGAALSLAKSSAPVNFVAASITMMLGASSAFGLTYFWDGNDITAGFGTASGTWAAPTVSASRCASTA